MFASEAIQIGIQQFERSLDAVPLIVRALPATVCHIPFQDDGFAEPQQSGHRMRTSFVFYTRNLAQPGAIRIQGM
jgi:hypothetical protein